MTGAPAVSVLLTVRDGERYIADAIASILTQTLTDLELVVVDHASTDRTPEILAAVDDPRVRISRDDRPELVLVLNRGLAACRAPLVARQDADDVSLPRRLERQAAFMAAHPDVVVVGTNAELIDADGRVIRTMELASDAVVRELERGSNPLAHTSVTFRREVVMRAGGYDPAFVLAHDFDLWLRLRRLGRVACLPETLVQVRKHGGNRSRDDRSGASALTAVLRDRIAERTGRADEGTLAAARRVAEAFHHSTWRQRRARLLEARELVAAGRWTGLRPRHLPPALARLGGRGAILPHELARLTRRALAEAGAERSGSGP